ncbi:dynamin family protein [Litchfieldia alkalitelluris]|uniref:dynamin family protein n=1 Tax=Litchfieldia alkalitelluris TaxID=304268 RepID=UPI000996EDE7|nr:dynamin family protein [Litchfieldia alkalitelluris]
MIHDVNVKRNKVLKMFASIKDTVSQESIKESGLIGTISKLRSSSFRIALVAPFSAGKSTFVNALIGTDLLSMNVLAETAAITRLKYGTEKRVVVTYRDGKRESFPKSPLKQVTDREMKEFLKSKTTVTRDDSNISKGPRVEEIVESVDVHWDLDICKGGVEIVDTPGLFARHSEHDQITNKVLPTVNAVLFIIEPDNVGDSNFLNVIAEYVENAKNSNLDTEGNHIFFIINKIDQFTEEQVLHAREELYRVVSPLLSHPQILAVSSYFALKARMYDNGQLSLNELKRDQHISFVDEEGFVVSGRQITENDIKTIHTISRMNVIEQELSAFFENKISRMVNESIDALRALCEREIKDSIELAQLMQKKISQKEGEYDKKLEALRNDFQQLTKQLKREVERSATATLVGTSTGKSEIEEVIDMVKKVTTAKLVHEIRKELTETWEEKKDQLTEENSDQILDQFVEKLLLKLGARKKALIRTSFRSLEIKYEAFTEELLEKFSRFEDNVNQTFSKQLDLPMLQKQMAFFQKDQLLSDVRSDIESLFEMTSYDVSSQLKDRMKLMMELSTYQVNASGFFNRLKAIFGKAEKVNVFDLEGFKESMTDLVSELIANAEEELRIDSNGISLEINKRIIAVNDKYQTHIFERIEHYQSWRERNITNLIDELKGEKGKALELLSERERVSQTLERLLRKLDHLYEVEFVEKGGTVHAV